MGVDIPTDKLCKFLAVGGVAITITAGSFYLYKAEVADSALVDYLTVVNESTLKLRQPTPDVELALLDAENTVRKGLRDTNILTEKMRDLLQTSKAHGPQLERLTKLADEVKTPAEAVEVRAKCEALLVELSSEREQTEQIVRQGMDLLKESTAKSIISRASVSGMEAQTTFMETTGKIARVKLDIAEANKATAKWWAILGLIFGLLIAIPGFRTWKRQELKGKR